MPAQQRACVVALVKIEAVLNPLLLHEFELPEQVGPDQHHRHPLFGVIRFVLEIRRAIRQAAPQNPATFVELAGRRFVGIGFSGRLIGSHLV